VIGDRKPLQTSTESGSRCESRFPD